MCDKYSGKSKCGFNCSKRARFKAQGSSSPYDYRYACVEHKHRIEHLPPVDVSDNERMTEADYQTWGRL